MVIIHGEDRSEYCKVPKKFKERHFFKTRNQLYRMRPEGMARMKIDYFGERRTDEVITYAENEIRPYQMKGNIEYTMDKFFMDLDAHKQMTGGTWFGKKAKAWFSGNNGKDLKEFITNPTAWMILIAVIIIVPTFLHF